MADPLPLKSTDAHYHCLDLFPINWDDPTGVDDQSAGGGILLEIWRTGGLVHSSLPIAEGAWVEIAPAGHTVQAQVTSCIEDEIYGFLVTVSVNPDQSDNWFPQSYCPPYLGDDEQETEPAESLYPGGNW